jgi:hypothetical protein
VTARKLWLRVLTDLEDRRMAMANRAWVARRRGQPNSADELATEALRLWRSLPMHYPVHWMPRWPLTAVALGQHRRAAALDYVRARASTTRRC